MSFDFLPATCYECLTSSLFNLYFWIPCYECYPAYMTFTVGKKQLIMVLDNDDLLKI